MSNILFNAQTTVQCSYYNNRVSTKAEVFRHLALALSLATKLFNVHVMNSTRARTTKAKACDKHDDPELKNSPCRFSGSESIN